MPKLVPRSLLSCPSQPRSTPTLSEGLAARAVDSVPRDRGTRRPRIDLRTTAMHVTPQIRTIAPRTCHAGGPRANVRRSRVLAERQRKHR